MLVINPNLQTFAVVLWTLIIATVNLNYPSLNFLKVIYFQQSCMSSTSPSESVDISSFKCL